MSNIENLKKYYDSFVTTKKKYPNFQYESECVHDDLLLHILAENYTSTQIKTFIDSLDIKEKFVLSYPPQVSLISVEFD